MTGVVVGTLFVLVGLVALVQALRDIRFSRRSESWPRTEGEVLQAEVERSASFYGRRYRPAVSYRYAVGEQAYLGNRAFFGDWTSWGSKWLASDLLGRFVVGSTISVYYDPSQPADSVLDPARRGASWLLGVLGLVLLILGVLSLVQGFKKW